MFESSRPELRLVANPNSEMQRLESAAPTGQSVSNAYSIGLRHRATSLNGAACYRTEWNEDGPIRTGPSVNQSRGYYEEAFVLNILLGACLTRPSCRVIAVIPRVRPAMQGAAER